MASLLTICVGLCLLGRASGQGHDCPRHEDTAVGSCMFLNCNKARGNTFCSWGSCYCSKGYCKVPPTISYSGNTHCVERVPDVTCEVSGFCYKSGLEGSVCEKGLCLCNQGYKVDDATKKCVLEDPTSALADAVARNATRDEIELLMKHQELAERAAAQSVVTAWLCGAAALVFVAGAGAWALRRRASRPTAQPASEDPRAVEADGYRVLVD